MPPIEQTEVAVCALAYRRPEGLAQLLQGLCAQRTPSLGDTPFRVIVVDNDPDLGAQAVCAGFEDRLGDRLRCVPLARVGIASGRNAALDAAREARWVAFLDDDEVPEPDWLEALLRTQRDTGADVVGGPVVPAFEIEPPAWTRAGGFFATPRRPTGTRLRTAFTHNVLLRNEAVRRRGLRFDPRLDFQGGSDTLFFSALARAGASLVWCDEALVVESIPKERMRARWLVRRKFRSGHTDAFVARELEPGGVRMRLILRGLGWVLGGSGLLVASPLGRHWLLRALRSAAYGCGLLLGAAGHRYEEYRPAPVRDRPLR